MNIKAENAKGMSAIMEGVGYLIDKKLQQSSFDKTLTGYIVDADYSLNSYTVRIDGYDYTDIPSAIKVSEGDSVLVTCPQNQTSQMMITSAINTTDYTTQWYNQTMTNPDDAIIVNDYLSGVLDSSDTSSSPSRIFLQLDKNAIYILYAYTTHILENANPHIVGGTMRMMATNILEVASFTALGSDNILHINTYNNGIIEIYNNDVGYQTHFIIEKK